MNVKCPHTRFEFLNTWPSDFCAKLGCCGTFKRWHHRGLSYWILESPCGLYLSPCYGLTLLTHPPTCEQAASCTCHHMVPNTKYSIPLCSGPSQSFLPRAVCARHSAMAAGMLTHLLAAVMLAPWACWVSLVGEWCHSGSSYVSVAPFDQSVFAVLVSQLFPSSVNLICLILFLFSCLFLSICYRLDPLLGT